ncbi:hypothetical protein DJICPGNB_26045 [Escherichia coli]|nr:hypothetical protein DJICPGNB_26045 [Escherichia coli]
MNWCQTVGRAMENTEKARRRGFSQFMDAMDTAKEALDAGTPLDLESLFSGEVASAMFATMFAGEFVRSGAKNYLELDYNVPAIGDFVVTINAKVERPVEPVAEAWWCGSASTEV